MIWKESIYTKISILLIMIVTAVLSLYGLYQYHQVKARSSKQLRDFADSSIQRLKEQLIQPLWEVEPRQIALTMSTEMGDARVFAVFVEEAGNESMNDDERQYLIKVGRIRNQWWQIVDAHEKPADPDLLFRRAEIRRQGELLGYVTVFITPKFMLDALRTAVRQIRNTIVMLNITLIISVLFMLNRMVIRSVKRIVHAVNKLAVGDTSSAYVLKHDLEKRDEIGLLASAVHQLVEATDETVHITEEIAAGNLDIEVVRRSEDDRLMLALQQLIGTLDRMLHETARLIQIAQTDDLNVRCLVDQFEGGWRDLLVGMNTLISQVLDSQRAVMRAEMQAVEERSRNIRQTAELLQKNEQRYRELVEGTDALVTTVNSKGIFTYVNQRAEKFFGLPPKACIGLSAFDFVHPDECESARNAFETWLNEKVKRATLENRQVSRTGEVYVMLWTINLHYDARGNIININSIARDITRRKEAEEQLHLYQKELEHLVEERTLKLQQEIAERTRTEEALKFAKTELEESNRALESRVDEELQKRQQQQRLLMQRSKLESLGTLAAGIAHEISQPLAGISMGLENMLLQIIAGELEQEYAARKIEVLLGHIARMKHVINHVRTFSRDQTSTTIERVFVNDVCRNALSLLNAQYARHNIQVTVLLNDKGGVILGNAFKLEQVVLNLLSNARDAVDEKADRLNSSAYQKQITLMTLLEQDHVGIAIEDNGIGLSEDARQNIFDPFFTTKDPEHGTGLGLSVSYGIIQEMEGEISVQSEEGEFTRLYISLPGVKANHTLAEHETMEK